MREGKATSTVGAAGCDLTMKGAVLAEILTSGRSGLSDAYSSTPHAVADFIAGIDPDADYYVGAVEV